MKSIASLTAAQLRRAAEIKETIQSLTDELNRIFIGPDAPAATPAAPKGARVKGKMSAAAKAKISAKLKLAWARRKAAAMVPKAAPVKSKMSPATKAQLSAKLKAYWAKKKAAQKK